MVNELQCGSRSQAPDDLRSIRSRHRSRVTERATITTDSGRCQPTSTDSASLVRNAAALTARAATWLRDEEARNGNASSLSGVQDDDAKGWPR